MSDLSRVQLVVPTVGRPQLTGLLTALSADADRPSWVWVVDDRPVATAAFTRHRLRGGSPDRREVATMAVTSAVIPLAVVWYAACGLVQLPAVLGRPGPIPVPAAGARTRLLPPVEAAVLFDRDGTIVHDVPYNGDPGRVQLVEVAAVATRMETLLGPMDGWYVCPHAETDGCCCRKPAPGLVERAAVELGVPVERCVVIGDTGGDVAAAVDTALDLPWIDGAPDVVTRDLGDQRRPPRLVAGCAPSHRRRRARGAPVARRRARRRRPTGGGDRPGWPDELAGPDRAAGPGPGARGRQHRPRPPRRRGRHPGGVAVRADRARGALAPVDGALRAARRPGHRLRRLPRPQLPDPWPAVPGRARSTTDVLAAIDRLTDATRQVVPA